MLRISSETGGKLACQRDWLLHSLVVRREAPSSLRMIIRSIPPERSEGGTLSSAGGRFMADWLERFVGHCRAFL
jgi:hypothetical protein